jgi:hypothetical protein
LLSVLQAILPAALLLLARSVVNADDPIDIDSRLEPLIDVHLVESLDGARLVMHRPTPREVAIVYDEPWEGNTSGYVTVFQDGDLYRMYYRGHAMDASGPLKMAHSEVTCYAQSGDGIHWEKPNLGLFDWEGSSENNIILMGDGTHNFSPFLDTNPDCAPDARYKAIGGTANTGLLAFKSSDGLHWSKLQDEPVFTDGAFDSQNVVFWDAYHGRYMLYFRFFSNGEFQGLRLIGVSDSVDFLNWSEQQELIYPDSPPQQMYTNQITPYYRAPHVLIGFPTRYVARPLTEHVTTLDPVELRANMTASHERVGTDLTDGLLMTSRDGLTFQRWDEAFLRPGPQGEGRWMYGDNYQALGLLETAATIPGGPPEISLYSEEESWRDSRRARRFTIRLDGFVSAQASLDGGEIVTKPIVVAGTSLVVNYATSAAGSLRVELQDAAGNALDGHSLDDCPEHYGDSVAQTIHWQSGSDVSRLEGRPIRVRFVLGDADLYSFQFVP